MIAERELRAHFGRKPSPNYFEVAVAAAREQAATIAPAVILESLIISPDALPSHYIARAVILDLQPAQCQSAIATVVDAIRRDYPHAQKTGWRAACDGLTLYFSAWTPTSGREAA